MSTLEKIKNDMYPEYGNTIEYNWQGSIPNGQRKNKFNMPLKFDATKNMDKLYSIPNFDLPTNEPYFGENKEVQFGTLMEDGTRANDGVVPTFINESEHLLATPANLLRNSRKQHAGPHCRTNRGNSVEQDVPKRCDHTGDSKQQCINKLVDNIICRRRRHTDSVDHHVRAGNSADLFRMQSAHQAHRLPYNVLKTANAKCINEIQNPDSTFCVQEPEYDHTAFKEEFTKRNALMGQTCYAKKFQSKRVRIGVGDRVRLLKTNNTNNIYNLIRKLNGEPKKGKKGTPHTITLYQSDCYTPCVLNKETFIKKICNIEDIENGGLMGTIITPPIKGWACIKLDIGYVYKSQCGEKNLQIETKHPDSDVSDDSSDVPISDDSSDVPISSEKKIRRIKKKLGNIQSIRDAGKNPNKEQELLLRSEGDLLETYKQLEREISPKYNNSALRALIYRNNLLTYLSAWLNNAGKVSLLYNQYLQLMSIPRIYWGGLLELEAIARALNIYILVVQDCRDRDHFKVTASFPLLTANWRTEPDPELTIYVHFNGSNHYRVFKAFKIPNDVNIVSGVITDTLADGDCLYHSICIGLQINGLLQESGPENGDLNEYDLRNIAVEFMEDHPENFMHLFLKELQMEITDIHTEEADGKGNGDIDGSSIESMGGWSRVMNNTSIERYGGQCNEYSDDYTLKQKYLKYKNKYLQRIGNRR